MQQQQTAKNVLLHRKYSNITEYIVSTYEVNEYNHKFKYK